MTWLLIALGGACGACLRHMISLWLGKNDAFPVATFIVNLSGSLLMGIAFALFKNHDWQHALIAVGFLGAFTTFSTFSKECAELIANGHTLTAILYVTLSVSLGTALCASAYHFFKVLPDT